MITRCRRTAVGCAIVLMALALSGCGSRAEISGKALFEDGTPVTKGQVRAHVDGVDLRGNITSDGSFTLYELKPGDGGPTGKEYIVWLANTAEAIPSTEKIKDPDTGVMVPMPDTVLPLVESSYTSVKTSPLRLNIPKGAKQFVYEIKVKKP